MSIISIFASLFLVGLLMFAFYKKRLADANKAWGEADKAKYEAKEVKLRLDKSIRQQAVESKVKQMKDEIFTAIENRHKTCSPYFTEMGVTVDSLMDNYGYKDPDILKQVLQILFEEGKLRYDQNQNQFVHNLLS